MNRLQQSRRQTFGLVYEPLVQNNVLKQTRYRNTYDVMERSFDQNSTDMTGEGIMDLAKEVLTKGKEAGKYLWEHREDIKKAGEMASDFYASDIGKAIQNVIPSSDATARAGFKGERHAILQLPNGKYGVANYMGPGTEVMKRLRRGDPPRTLSDKTAMRHDIDYAIASASKDKATQNRMIRDADKRMVRNLNRIALEGTDAQKNIFQGRRLIQGKMAMEDVGLMKKGSFGGPLEKINNQDMILLKSSRNALAQEGYGNLPTQQLKLKLLKKHARSKKGKKGKGAVMSRRRQRRVHPMPRAPTPSTQTAEELRELIMEPRPNPAHSRTKSLSVSDVKVAGEGLKIPGGALRLAGQRGLKRSHISKINKVCKCEAMKGKGIKDMFKSVIKTLGPIAKKVGPTILKEIVLPMAKAHIEKKYGAKGDGLRLAGQRGRGKKKRKAKTMKGKGKGVNTGYASRGKSYGTTKGYKLMKGVGLGLAGKGELSNFVIKSVLPSIAKSVGIDMKEIPITQAMKVVKKAVGVAKSGDVKSIAMNLSKVLIPLLTHGKLKSIGVKTQGAVKDVMKVAKKVHSKLNPKLVNGIMKALKYYVNKSLSGKGMSGRGLGLPGSGFWGDFAKGFTMVFKPASKILAAGATAMGQPEIGVPLGVISELL